MTNLKTITETASELGKDAKESIEEFGRSAVRRVDEARDGTGGALHAVASTVRTTGRKSSKAIDIFTTGTANRLDATASFLKHHDLGDAYTGVRRFSLRHLTGSLVAAAAVGFIAGTALSRAAHSGGKEHAAAGGPAVSRT